MKKMLQVTLYKVIAACAVIASQIPVECHGQNSFEMQKMECLFSASYYNESDSECILKSADGRNKFISGHAVLTKAIDELEVSVEVYSGNSLADKNFLLLFNATENICSLAAEVKTSHVASIVRSLWEMYTNIPFGCPVPPGKYYVHDVDYNDLATQNIPVAILSGHYKIDLKARHKTEIVLNAIYLLSVEQKKPT